MNLLDMNEFIKAYNELIFDENKIKPEYIGLNIFNILNEWVESPDLLQFPKELQIDLCKNLRRHFDNLYIISYKKIIKILEKYDYDYVDDVICGMKKYDAINRGYLILISLAIDESTNLFNNKTLNFIKENFNDIYDNAYDIFSKVYNNRYVDGLTIFHRDIYEPENSYTCIYINRKCSNLKDTLEHELTHFIKNVANQSNKFPKIYSGLTPEKLKSRQIKCVDYIYSLFNQLNFSDQTCFSIKEIVLRAFTEIEEQPTIKSIINSFIRCYEKDEFKYEFNHLLKNIKQIENSNDRTMIIEFRLNWLDEFLDKINSFEIFKEHKSLIENYFSKKNYEKDYKIEFILKCVSYLCFKENYPEYDIDKIVKENFKRFKFKDV